MNEILKQVKDYGMELSQYTSRWRLPTEWFKVPDHIAVKGADSADFERLVSIFKPESKQVNCIEMDDRRLATAQLTGSISVGRFGEVSWVEIMEPRPEKVGQDVVGVEHMEFYYPNFVEIEKVLNVQGQAYEMQQNPGHHWVNLVINSGGQELKLNNRVLADVVTHELEAGQSYLL